MRRSKLRKLIDFSGRIAFQIHIELLVEDGLGVQLILSCHMFHLFPNSFAFSLRKIKGKFLYFHPLCSSIPFSGYIIWKSG